MSIKGPVVYATLFDKATADLVHEVRRVVDEDASAMVNRLSGRLGDMLFSAYQAGLRDGFQQGVQAAVEDQADGVDLSR